VTAAPDRIAVNNLPIATATWLHLQNPDLNLALDTLVHSHIYTPAMADRFPSLDEFDAGTLRRCSPDAPPDTLLTHPRPERGPR
jgi:hypothetical protein